MRQAGVSLEHDDRATSGEAEHLTLDSGQFASATATLAPRSARPGPSSVRPAPGSARPTAPSPQPAPNPIAVEVAERYARALTLSATSPAPPEPRTPRRSRAAMRDRALEPAERRRRGAGAQTPERASRAGGAALEPEAPVRVSSWNATDADLRTPTRRSSWNATDADLRSPTRRSSWDRPDRDGRTPATAAPVAAPSELPGHPTGVAGRRTVTIRGRGAERNLDWPAYDSSRRPALPAHERPGFRPDRAALWAFVLGLLLVLVAATSAHGATLAHVIR